MRLDELTVLTASFNDSTLTCAMIKSLRKQIGDLPEIVIIDNGDTTELDHRLKSAFTVMDNFKHKLLADEIQPSRNHCKSIDYAIKNFVNTKYCLLVDNDILFKPSVKKFLATFDENYLVAGEIGFDVIPPNRLFPYFCLINIDEFLKQKIDYFNRDFCMKLFDKNGKELHGAKFGHSGLYDTGYYFYESVKNWPILRIKISDYCVHMKNGSFGKKSVEQFLKDNRNLF